MQLSDNPATTHTLPEGKDAKDAIAKSIPKVASGDSLSSQSNRPQRDRKPFITYEPEVIHHTSTPSSGGSFTKGSRVYIVGTTQVLQRSPHYVGRIGTVKEVPGELSFRKDMKSSS